MAHQMSSDELDRFLSEGSRTGKLATVRADGSPHVAPVWFILDQDDLVFMTGATTVKGKAILRETRVAVLVDDERPPFAFATIEGTVSISATSTRCSRCPSPSLVGIWVTNWPKNTADATQSKVSYSCASIVSGSQQWQKSPTRAQNRGYRPVVKAHGCARGRRSSAPTS